MKRSKRQESSIIIYFSFYFILLLGLIIYSFSVLYPKIIDIENKKEITKNTFEELDIITKKWINYWEFNTLKSVWSLNSYQKELLNSIDANFYNENLKNNTDKSYATFLEERLWELNNPIEKEKLKKKENQIINLLPPYSESDVNGEDNLLSDFKFINYIENLFATFWLEYDSEIWISEINLVEEFSETWKKSSLDTDIYYIPLNLSLEWTKYNMINFLYFIEYVWNIKIEENELNIHNQNNDNFLYRRVKILLKNDQPSASNYSNNYIENYNIFENQLIDIESIEFGEYLDGAEKPIIQDTQSIASRVKETQANEKISLDISLRFYIKWVQNIKIIDHLKLYITYFNTTKSLIAKQMWNKNLNTSEKNVIKAMQADINEMSQTLKTINLSISRQENLNESLKSAANYTNILHTMHSKMWYNIYVSNFINEYKKLMSDEKIKNDNQTLYNYLLSLETDIEWLKKTDSESDDNYKNRINNKKIFENVIQIQKNIELKK